MRPRIVPSGTVRSTPSTARTPPKCVDNHLSPSAGARLDARDTAACSVDEPLERERRAGIEQATRANVHGEQNEAAEQQVAPIAHEAQAFDQEALDEDD